MALLTAYFNQKCMTQALEDNENGEDMELEKKNIRATLQSEETIAYL